VIKIVEASCPNLQAVFALQHVLSCADRRADLRHNFSGIAVLYRRRQTGRLLQKAMRELGVQFNRQTTSPYALAGVRDVVACLTLVAAEETKVSVACKRTQVMKFARACMHTGLLLHARPVRWVPCCISPL
jgi:superfamily I DNA/RNA helicase